MKGTMTNLNVVFVVMHERDSAMPLDLMAT